MIKKFLIDKIGMISKYLSHIGNISLVAMMLLSTADVIGRYFFNSPVLGAYEITEYLMIIIVFSFFAFTQSEKGHINVDIAYNLLPSKVQVAFERFNHVICLIMLILVTWRGIYRVIDIMEAGEESLLLKIPDYPFAIFVVIGSIVFTLEYLKDVILLFTEGTTSTGAADTKESNA
ncbi:MAG: TRAP transporter small permease [Spirochaetes bacterium]|nr:TRAP transporter small permease [Spirochaetota bacterium]